MAMVWTALGRRGAEPPSPLKMAIGLASGRWLPGDVLRCEDVQPGVKVSMFFLVALYFLHSVGELCLSPIGLSLVNKLAPAKFASLLMAVWFLANAAANYLAGYMSSLYPDPASYRPRAAVCWASKSYPLRFLHGVRGIGRRRRHHSVPHQRQAGQDDGRPQLPRACTQGVGSDLLHEEALRACGGLFRRVQVLAAS